MPASNGSTRSLQPVIIYHIIDENSRENWNCSFGGKRVPRFLENPAERAIGNTVRQYKRIR
jgi:hypothetical protein